MKFKATIFAAGLATGLLGLSSTPSRAMPIAPQPEATADIVKVYGGCGPYRHRGPWGGCRRGGQWGGWGPRRWRRW